MIDWFLQHYPDCPPLAYIMRQCFPWRWFRIHSLSESKRYPESAVDESILLMRHNMLATEVLGENTDCLLVVTRREGDVLESIYTKHSAGLSSVYRFEDDEDMEQWISWASIIRWSPAQYNDMILAVANEEIYNTLFISSGLGGIYVPYDGGADVFDLDAGRLREIKVRYQECASKRPDGL